ncbi:MAG: hypothetical protein ACREB0_00190 [Sphingopyxis sp.]
MFSALISFLGGSAFRMLWGEVASYFTAKQSHKYEIERLRVQNDLDAAQHARNQEAIRVQAELGVKTIEVQRDADVSRVESDAWRLAVAALGTPTGIKWVDAWNATIRPLLASAAIVVLAQEIIANAGTPTPHVLLICDAILGMYVADRSLAKRGK